MGGKSLRQTVRCQRGRLRRLRCRLQRERQPLAQAAPDFTERIGDSDPTGMWT